MFRVLRKFLICLLFISFSVSWARAESPFPVAVSILPQKYFVQQIGKEKVRVQVMVQPGASPATYEPKPGQMAALARARLYFSIGVPFERVWLDRIAATNEKMAIVSTDKGIEKRMLAAHRHHDEDDHHDANHSHGKAAHGGHDHDRGPGGIPDPHIWLSPPLVRMQVAHMAAALQQADPAHEAFYRANAASFLREIDALDADLNRLFSKRRGHRFMVFHPSWGYFAQAYGLRQIPIEMEGKDPKPAQLKALIEHAREEAINVVFVQPQFSRRSAELIAREIGGQVVVADPLAEDWAANLRRVADKFEVALK